MTDDLSLFADASRGFFMPQLNSVQVNTTGVQTYKPEVIKLAEGGFKYAHGPLTRRSPLITQPLPTARMSSCSMVLPAAVSSRW